ncbi:MAG: ATP-binding protein [Gammaproteobacteria bacterium]|nr:ATP-binding protein [Gammaproteobacteria bacterium]
MRLKITQLLEDLKFTGMANALQAVLDAGIAQGHSFEEILWHLLSEEARYRQEKSLAYRIKQARLPWDWTLETFPFKRQPGVNASQIRSLAGLEFIKRAQNLVLIGPPGTGKTGLAISLARKAALNGSRARFYNAQDLLDELYASLADRTTSRLLNRLANYDLLVLDELGYLSIKPEQANAFFKLMEMRYSRKSTVITTNLLCAAAHNKFVVMMVDLRL